MRRFSTLTHRIRIANIVKGCIFAVLFEYSIEKCKVKNMKLKDVQLSRPTQYWVKTSDIKPQIKAGLHSELRDWVQYVIMEAETNKDFKKKAQFLSLLADLNTTED